MKTFIISILSLSSLLVGCQEKHNEIEVSKTQFADETENWDIALNYSKFTSKDEQAKKSCDILNKEIDDLVINLQDSLKKNATDLFANLATEGIERPVWKYSLTIADSVFMANDRFISVRLTVYTFTGGAHGMTQFYSFNYDVKNQRLLDNKDVLNYENKTAIDQLLKTNFKNPEECFDVDPTLEAVSVINISPTNTVFTYEQYILGAYVCGVAEVLVPTNELKEDFLLKLK